ncbi:hypothetical protein AtNW77_Chr1g0004761 [Arabidopsis thaliana]
MSKFGQSISSSSKTPLKLTSHFHPSICFLLITPFSETTLFSSFSFLIIVFFLSNLLSR